MSAVGWVVVAAFGGVILGVAITYIGIVIYFNKGRR